MPQRLPFAAAACALTTLGLLAAACSGGGDDEPRATAEPTAAPATPEAAAEAAPISDVEALQLMETLANEIRPQVLA